MKIKSTYEIFADIWQDYTYKANNEYEYHRIPYGWNKSTSMTIKDVEMWEELYYQGGNVGIYVAWSPHAEFYMIVHHLLKGSEAGVETFFGRDAYLQCANRSSQLGITFDINTVFADENDLSHILNS